MLDDIVITYKNSWIPSWLAYVINLHFINFFFHLNLIISSSFNVWICHSISKDNMISILISIGIHIDQVIHRVGMGVASKMAQVWTGTLVLLLLVWMLRVRPHDNGSMLRMRFTIKGNRIFISRECIKKMTIKYVNQN